jgi:hypothetical protein
MKLPYGIQIEKNKKNINTGNMYIYILKLGKCELKKAFGNFRIFSRRYSIFSFLPGNSD